MLEVIFFFFFSQKHSCWRNLPQRHPGCYQDLLQSLIWGSPFTTKKMCSAHLCWISCFLDLIYFSIFSYSLVWWNILRNYIWKLTILGLKYLKISIFMHRGGLARCGILVEDMLPPNCEEVRASTFQSCHREAGLHCGPHSLDVPELPLLLHIIPNLVEQ